MEFKGRTCLICNCENTMALDPAKLSDAIGVDVDHIHDNLCRTQLDRFEDALNSQNPLIVACTQEAPLFREIAEEVEHGAEVAFINIRETAGWSDESADTSAKIAAILNAAVHETQPARLLNIASDGMCLVYGSGQAALEMAELLSQKLSVTLLLSGDEEIILPRESDVPIYRGQIRTVSGSFGNFAVTVDQYAPLMPSSKSELNFVMARDGAETACSLIYDMSGKTPLVTGHTRRDGYKRVDPGDPAAMLRAVFDLSEMVGEFEKPIYVDYNADICAHSRSQKAGCSKCLDVCPAGAIFDAGDFVEIDAGICGGCGSCHSVCPTGAIAYQYPRRTDTIARARDAVTSFQSAGGGNAVLLLHDDRHGGDLINASARFGRGLPADTVPLTAHATSMFGHVEFAALLANGAAEIVILADPANEEDYGGLQSEIELVNHITQALGFSGGARCHLVFTNDPDELEEFLHGLERATALANKMFQPTGSKRDIARLALSALHAESATKPDVIALPVAAPYGIVAIDQSSCTLCMACTSACPANAIIDTPGEPTLRFVESACVQCGLCVQTCPESALELTPQLNFAPDAMQPKTLYQEEPFECISCGTPFATKSTIERITDQLAGKHTMFANDERAKLIQMCENCRVEAQANSSEDPFSSNARPRVRTTEDYLEAERGGPSADDFLMDD